MTTPDETVSADATPPSKTAATGVLLVLTLAYVFNLLDRSIVYILQEDIKAEFALQDWQIGLLGGAAFGLFYAVMGIPIARLSETRSRTTLLKICVLLWSALTALCGMAQSFIMLLLIRTGVAVGEAGGSPLSHSLISDYYPPQQRATALAVYSIAVPIGLLAGSVLGGFIADAVGWRWAFVLVGLPGVAVAGLIHLVIKEPRRGRLDPAAPTHDDRPPPFLSVVRQMLGDKRVLLVLAGSSVAAFAAYGVTTFMAGWYVRSFQLDLKTVGLIFGLIFGVSAAIGTYAGGALSDRLGARDRRWYMLLPALCLASAAPLYVLGFRQDSPWIAAAVMCLPGLLTTAHYGATFSTVNNAFNARMRTTAVSLMFLVHAIIGMSLGPLFTGGLSDLFAGRILASADAGALCAASPANDICAAASAQGLTTALTITALLFLVAAALYGFAAMERKSLAYGDETA